MGKADAVIVIKWEVKYILKTQDASGSIIKNSFYLTVNFAKRHR